MRAGLILMILSLLPFSGWAARKHTLPTVRLAEVIRAERDHGIPFENIRLIYKIPCDAEYYDAVSNRYPKGNMVEIGVLLKPAAEPTCDVATSVTKALRFVINSSTYPKLIIHGLVSEDAVGRLNY